MHRYPIPSYEKTQWHLCIHFETVIFTSSLERSRLGPSLVRRLDVGLPRILASLNLIKQLQSFLGVLDRSSGQLQRRLEFLGASRLRFCFAWFQNVSESHYGLHVRCTLLVGFEVFLITLQQRFGAEFGDVKLLDSIL